MASRNFCTYFSLLSTPLFAQIYDLADKLETWDNQMGRGGYPIGHEVKYSYQHLAVEEGEYGTVQTHIRYMPWRHNILSCEVPSSVYPYHLHLQGRMSEPESDPDPSDRGTDPRIQIRTKMSHVPGLPFSNLIHDGDQVGFACNGPYMIRIRNA